MKCLTARLVLLLVQVILAGCSSSPGPDSISSHNPAAGGAPPDCLICHSPANPSLDPLQTNGTGTAGKHVAHVTGGGFACTKCHFNYTSHATHMNGTMDTSDPAVLIVYFDSTNPIGQWTGDTGAGTGSCKSLVCHGATNTLEWYGTGTSFTGCGSCHSSIAGTRRQITGPGGDFAANSAITSHHVSGVNDPTHDQCLVCHDQSTHTAGTVRLRNADTGASIAYDPANASSLEPFCLSCHDPDGATSTYVAVGTVLDPFGEDVVDGIVLGQPPYPYATRIATSWAKSYGHGPNGNHTLGTRLTCMGDGTPGTGCHGSNGTINAHGSVNQVLASKPFKYDNGPAYAEADYDLCFTCHSLYAGFTKEVIFGVKQNGILDQPYGPNNNKPPYYISAVTTLFRDHNGLFTEGCYDLNGNAVRCNDGLFWGSTNMNLHWFHIARYDSILIFTGDSDFRGTGTRAGINCVNCHDVHGSSTSYGAVYDEMGYKHNLPYGANLNLCAQMKAEAYDQSQNYLANYPTYCAFNCHPVQGPMPTKAWFFPLTE